jgi:hypothetical protein
VSKYAFYINAKDRAREQTDQKQEAAGLNDEQPVRSRVSCWGSEPIREKCHQWVTPVGWFGTSSRGKAS